MYAILLNFLAIVEALLKDDDLTVSNMAAVRHL